MASRGRHGAEVRKKVAAVIFKFAVIGEIVFIDGGGGGIRHAIIMKLAGCANCKSNSELYAAVTRCEIELLVCTRKIYIIFWRVDVFFLILHAV